MTKPFENMKKTKQNKYPGLESWILNIVLPETDIESLNGDFLEIYLQYRRKYGFLRARFWLWKQILKSAPLFILNSMKWSFVMFSNYLKIAFRYLKKYKGFSFINITGLATGMACSILIFLWVWNELSYDKHHEKADQIYRVEYSTETKLAVTPAPMAEVLKDIYPEVLNSVRICNWGRTIVKYEDKQFEENRVLFADSEIFSIFTIPLVKGDANSALKKPNSAVITDEMALKYFGDRDCIGKVIQFDNSLDFQITGIVREAPETSHFHYDFIASFNTLPESRISFWGNNFLYTYVLLPENYSPNHLKNKFPEMIKTYVAPQMEEFLGQSFDSYLASGRKWSYDLRAVRDIHLHANNMYEMEANGDITYVYIFSAIAFFILIIACINFMNLATAFSITRAKEVGLRKVMGSSRKMLIYQYLGESVFISILSMAAALGIVFLTLPAFKNLVGKQAELFNFNGFLVSFVLLGTAVIVGIIAGSYPAFYMALLNPVTIIKGKISEGMKNVFMRRILVILQFTISIIIIFSTIMVLNQLEYLISKKLGFKKEQVMVISRAYPFPETRDAFKETLLLNPEIKSVSLANTIPGGSFGANAHFLEGQPSKSEILIQTMYADYDYVKALDLKIKEGRYFSKDISSDTNCVIVNEATVKAYNLQDPIGKIIVGGSKYDGSILVTKKIIGVLEDFHFESLHQRIKPFMIEFLPKTWGNLVLVSMNSDNLSRTIGKVEKVYKEFSPDYPFNWNFLSEKFDNQYQTEIRGSQIIAVFSGLAVFIACLGLFGLISFTTRKRMKEIGIRKVIGSSESGIVLLLFRETFLLVIASGIFAFPFGYILIKKWLQNFAYQIPFSGLPFVQTIILIIFVSIFTVSYHSIKVARTNPADSLRNE
ncbi:ABC transporter permease [candidate division KSB1 bacterium]